MPSRTRSTLTLLILGAWLSAGGLSGCGYRRAGMGEALPKGLRTLGIPTLKNTTQSYEIEQRFTRALVREFVERSPFSIVSSDAGVDAVLRGEITGIGAAPVIYGRDTFQSTYLITIFLRVSLVATKTNKVIYQNDGFIFRDQYTVNARVFRNPDRPDRMAVEQFFSEENPAVERIAKDFAASVVTSVLETF